MQKKYFPWLQKPWRIILKLKVIKGYILKGKRQLNFRYKLARNQPYFGHVLSAMQTDPRRESYMKQLICKETHNLTDSDFTMLEVGAWAGRSSIIWADVIKKNTTGFLTCVDVWEPFESTTEKGAYLPWMQKALGNRKVFNLFLHNIAVLGLEDTIKPYKGSSERVLPTLRDNFFNMVFIDGSHQYSHVTIDIEHGARLTTEGGILCGDDLELQMQDVDETKCRKCKEEDYIEDPKTGIGYHPGVALAVYEYFKTEVSCYNGFWVMRKTKDGWLSVHL